MSGTTFRAGRRVGVFLAALSLFGPCLISAPISRYEKAKPRQGHLIPAVPYEKWARRNWCGPACLAMVLDYWGGPGSSDQSAIAEEIFDPASQASFNSAMVLYPRGKDLASYSCQGDLALLKELVRNDIPVIVLTKTLKRVPKGHYRVVIGFDDEAGLIVFHDPLLGARQAMSARSFMKIWRLGSDRNRCRWMMAVIPPSRSLPVPGLASDPMTLINIATAYYRRGDYERSRAEWEKVRGSLAGDPYPVFSLAMVSLRDGRAGEAEALAEEALRLDPACAQAADVLGLAYAAQGRIVEAWQALGRALRLDPKQAFIRDHYLKVRDLYIRNARAATAK